jgi:putative sterol carrier protein
MKTDRGMIYVGPSKITPILVFNMRERDFIDLLSGKLNYMKAITGKKMKIKGNVLNVMGFYNGFVVPYLAEYLNAPKNE